MHLRTAALGIGLAGSLIAGAAAQDFYVRVPMAGAVAPDEGTPPPDGLERVSIASDGTPGNGHSTHPKLSSDGRYVVFESSASNLVAGDNNARDDIFVHDRVTGETTLVSRASGGGAVGNGHSRNPAITPDARFIAFESQSTNLAATDTSNDWDIYVHDTLAGTTTHASKTHAGADVAGDAIRPNISANGNRIVFVSSATGITADAADTGAIGDVYVRDLGTGAVFWVSQKDTGGELNNHSDGGVLNADGSKVYFGTRAGNITASDGNSIYDVYEREVGQLPVAKVNIAPPSQGVGNTGVTSITPNGRYVLMNGHLGGSNNAAFRRDLVAGVSDFVTAQANGNALTNSNGNAALANDGTLSAFESASSSAVGGRGDGSTSQIYIYRIGSGVLGFASVGTDDSDGNGASSFPALSGDGRVLAFRSLATNLIAGDGNGVADIFVAPVE